VFVAWILQILLTEILHVPVSIESKERGSNVDFYDVGSRMDYSSVDGEVISLENSYLHKDCRTLQTHNSQPENPYIPCAHLSPEIWSDGDGDRIHLVDQGAVEPFQEMGALGEQYWFIPKFLALRDPTLVSYAGLAGEHNRRKVAETFLTPTNWKDYCELVSQDNCTSTMVLDKTTNETIPAAAVRPPINSKEAASYFINGLYSGHFRKTEANNCNNILNKCHGHITDYPCRWSSFVPQLTHNLNIALKSGGSDPVGGYSYQSMTEIWAAANHTKSAVIMMWWKPEALYQTHIGTDSEFTHVVLPPPTQECKESRERYTGRCTNDTDAHRGSELGICDSSAQSLRKMISSALKELAQDPTVEPELWSPAYDIIKNYRVTELDLGDLLSRWLEQKLDPHGFDARNAVCQWAADNLDMLESFIPETYPRVVEEQKTSDEPIFITAAVSANVVMVLLLVSLFFTYRKRNTKAMYYVQPSFLYFLEIGLLLVTTAAWQMTVPSEAGACIVRPWLESIGYYFALAPLLIRINSINKLLASGKQMRRVKVGKRRLLLSVFAGTCLVVAYVALWTAVDPPTRRNEYEISEGLNEDGHTTVTKTAYCGSESNAWQTANVAWQLLILFVASVLAFMVSHVPPNLIQADTRPLSALIMAHFFFSTLRLALVLLHDSVDPVMSMAYMALIMIAECFVAMVIFIFPKLAANSELVEDESATMPDLYVRTTVLQAQIKGFSAWSSLREPVTVFRFLECVFHSIDQVSDRKGVFKVETIAEGTYVAATGIPTQRKDHAVLMGRFATELQSLFSNLIEELEVVYGPDTGKLSLQIGIHSGPVTGGFLKGKAPRFQLFGETATIARQLCTTGEPGKIHISQKTADLLEQSGKNHWIKERESTTGTSMQTYWLSKKKVWGSMFGVALSDSSIEDEELQKISVFPRGNEQRNRLITWNLSILHELLKQIYARRSASTAKLWSSESGDTVHSDTLSQSLQLEEDRACDVPLEEVKEIITLPPYNNKIARRQRDWEEIQIPSHVMDQLRCFVATVAELHQDHPFHNFSHTSHMVMATVKHLKRIVVPTDLDIENEDLFVKHKTAAVLHEHTYGITSDPLTQFACVFSSLIHHVSHPGIPNINFVKEEPMLAEMYKNRSVAEQRSLTLSWDLLVKPEFADLKLAICGDNEGFARFRQLLVNMVMATDLGDKELRKLRNRRWEDAFRNPESPQEESDPSTSANDLNRKATIVIEHLIQAANVSHTMQHWEIYLEWSGKLFEELYAAYRQGRTDRNPADFWYEGEAGFFEHYVIPLSKKLHDCGVFGVSSDEDLNYATRNHELWVSQGRKVTEELLQRSKEVWDAQLQVLEEEPADSADARVKKIASMPDLVESSSDHTSEETPNPVAASAPPAMQGVADIDESQNNEQLPLDETTISDDTLSD